MKMKKLVAVGAAAAMSMAMCVNVFAASEVTKPVNASYASGAATYSGTITAKNGTQMTVIVFKKSEATGTVVSDTNIEYINQDTANAGLYAGMKTKNDLLAVGEDGTATNAGDYIVRVGYYDAEGAWKLAEGSFTVGTKTADAPSYTLGDVDGDPGVKANDASAIAKHVAKVKLLTGNNLLAADVDGDPGVKANDASTVAKYVAKLITKFPAAK